VKFTFDDLVAVMAKLRGADGCPWDREQTPASLAPYLLEESHEVLEAIGSGDSAALRAELGDVLLQVVFHAQMASEAGTFDAGAVVDGLTRKLLHRHPHVFGDLRLGTAREVKAHWDEIKRREAPEREPIHTSAAPLAQEVLGELLLAAVALAAAAGVDAESALREASARLAARTQPG
jgi:MazG family protein